jgi:hypothetical protein
MSLEFSSRQQGHNEENIDLEEVSPQELKPVDGGRDAWTVLIAGFIFEAIFWGN